MGSPGRPVVVLDTNALVSAVGWRGAPHRLYRLCRAGTVALAMSPDLIDELGRVLRYPKLELEESDVAAFVGDGARHARIVRPDHRVHVIAGDPDDNRVLECAISAEADWIASGDDHLLALEEFSGIPIKPPAELIRLLTHQNS